MAKVPVISPDGTLGDIEDTELDAALAQGFRLPSEQEQAKQAQDAKLDLPGTASVISGLRGLSAGISDRFLSGVGFAQPKELDALREANPTASVAGEVGGTVAGALLSGGENATVTAPGLISRLGVGAERATARALGAGESALGRIAGKVVGGATEGAAYGVQTAVTDAYLKDHELTAEQIIAAAGTNALLGGVAGGGLGALGEGGKKLVGALTPKQKEAAALLEVAAGGAPKPSAATADAAGAAGAAPEAEAAQGFAGATGGARAGVPPIDEVAGEAARRAEEAVQRNAPLITRTLKNVLGYAPSAEEMVLRDLDIKKAAARQLREKGIIESAPRALLDDPRYAAAKSPKAKIDLLATKRQEALDTMLSTAKKLDDAAEPQELISTLDLAAKIDTDLITPLRKASNANAGPIRQLEAWTDDLLSRGEYLTMSEAEEFKRLLDPHLRWDSATENIVRDKLRQFRGMLNGEIETTAKKISKRAFGSEASATEWKKAKRLYGEMTELLGEGEERLADAKVANRFFSLTDNIAGAATGAVGLAMSGPGGLAFAAAGALANKWGRERLPHVMALVLDKLAQNKAVDRAALRLQDAIKAAPEGALGAFEGPLREAAAKGPREAAAAHVALSQAADDSYKAVADTHGFHAFTEAVVTDGASQKVYERIQDALEHFTGRGTAARQGATVAASGFLARPLLPGVANGDEPKDKHQQLARRADELAKLAADPELMTGAIAKAMEGVPEEAKAPMGERLARAVAFLQAKVPKRPANDSQFPALQRPWRPSDAEVSAFERYAGAINDPLSVLDGLAQGRVTREAVEALQAVYPKLYGEMQAAVAERLADKDLRIDYNKRLALGVLFGAPATPELEPGMFQVLQATHQPKGGNGPSGPPTGKPYHPDRGLASFTERLAGRS